jgi:hypothetical protein
MKTKARLSLRKDAIRSLTREQIVRVGGAAMERLLQPEWPWISCTGITL